MILSCSNVCKSFADETILDNISFNINDGEKAALIGSNGCGKSTLLKIITSLMNADSGEITLRKDAVIGYLEQHPSHNSELTIYEEVSLVKKDVMELEAKIRECELLMKDESGALEDVYKTYTRLTGEFEAKNGYAYKSEIAGILNGLKIPKEDYDRKVSTLSGGQKTRVALGKLLLEAPDLLILDEPTNHLDMESIAWLEGFLSSYKKAVLIVAHDRYFLDRVVTKVIGIEGKHAFTYNGNYSDYAKKRALVRESMIKEYLNQQRDIKHQQEVIDKLRSFNREKSIKRAESRQKMLDKITPLERPVEFDEHMKIHFKPAMESGKDVLTVTSLSKTFGSNTLFKDLTFELKKGERLALIGANGTGKTTILKIINKILCADSGTITYGSNVSVGYYDQEQQVLNDDNNLFDEISDAYPDMTITAIRNLLASFLFTEDDVFKLVGMLSGGEKGRLSLAKLMLSNANLLILDEPTNHLDITSREILEDALNSYEGTVLFVSHDRYFINKTATRIIDLTGGTLISYPGNYDFYTEHKEIYENAVSSGQTTTVEDVKKTSGDNWKEHKKNQALERKRLNDIKKLEDEIEALEKRNEEIDALMQLPENSNSAAALLPLCREKEDNESRLLLLMEQWEEISS